MREQAKRGAARRIRFMRAPPFPFAGLWPFSAEHHHVAEAVFPRLYAVFRQCVGAAAGGSHASDCGVDLQKRLFVAKYFVDVRGFCQLLRINIESTE